MQNVAAKKAYVVPVIVGRGAVAEKTLGLPNGIGEPSVGLVMADDV